MTAPEIETRVAAAGLEEHLFAGAPVFARVAGAVSFAPLIFAGITGRWPTESEARVLDAVASCGTVADPRVWPMKVGRIVASYGGALSGAGAGLLALSSGIVGPWRTAPAAAKLLQEVAAATRQEDDVDQALDRLLEKRRFLPGFGVPFRERDERLAPLRRCLEAEGHHQRMFFSLWERLADWTRRRRKLEPNFGSAVAATLLDLEVAPEETGIIGAALVLHMVLANAHEGAQQQAEALRKLPDEYVRYVGTPARVSPRGSGGG